MTRIIKGIAAALAVATGLGAATAAADGPDVIVGDLYQVASYGSLDGISAFSVGNVTCNIGGDWLNWFNLTNEHPVWGHSMYRLKNDRFEHIGQSWLNHGFYAVSEGFCFTDCQPTDGSHLGVHCSEPEPASINGVQSLLSPKYQVNAHTGEFPYPPANPPYSGAIARRLQVKNSDLDPSSNVGALYFVEGQFVTPDDAAAGNQNNNASYRRVTVYAGPGSACPPGRYCLALSETTQQEQSAVRAWKDNDPTVAVTDAQVPGEGLFILAAKATDLGDGYWHYEYALQNLNSDRSGGSFTVPIPPGVSIRNIGFHDVDYHSGEIWDGKDWTVTVDRCGWKTWSTITWSSTSYAVDPNANALRWGTLYNFRFDAHTEPNWEGYVPVTLGLFKPGVPHQIRISTIGPHLPLPPYMNGDSDCDLDVDLFDCRAFQTCFSGAIGTPAFVAPSVGCLFRFDLDHDGDVDLADYKVFVFMWANTGP